jgi:pimeloyl-ACP methyl ester carboxylesterase
MSLGGTVSEVAWKTKPSWYVITKTDRAVSTDLQIFMAKRIHASSIEIPSCHVVMLAHPDVVNSVIRRNVGGSTKRVGARQPAIVVRQVG